MAKKIDPAAQSGASLGSMGDLLRARGLSPSGSPPTTPPAAAPPPAGPPAIPRIVLRRERAGRGGHPACVIEGVPAGIVDDWARQLRKALGTGTTVEEGRIVVQGDQGDRIEAWARARGVVKVVRGDAGPKP